MHTSTVAAGKPPQSCGSHIHDPVAKLKEELPLLRLRKEVSLVIMRVNVRHNNLAVLDTLAHEEMASRDMLRFLMVLRVVRYVSSTCVVNMLMLLYFSKLERRR